MPPVPDSEERSLLNDRFRFHFPACNCAGPFKIDKERGSREEPVALLFYYLYFFHFFLFHGRQLVDDNKKGENVNGLLKGYLRHDFPLWWSLVNWPN